jgi:hypothetical protein
MIKSLVIVGLVLGTSARAQSAGGSGGVEASTGTFGIAIGLKWAPLRYTHPIGVAGTPLGPMGVSDCSNGGGDSSGRGECLYGWQTTSLDNYIGFFFHPQIGAMLSLDLGYGSFHWDSAPLVQGGMPINRDVSYFQFGFALGGKFYLTRPTGQRVSPYLYVDIFKYFVSLSTSDQIPPEQVGAIAGLHAPFGFNLAFGAEYFFTNSFSLGAEVIGLKFAYVEGDHNDNPMTPTSHLTEKDWYFTFYTAITLNYRFLASASVRLEADVESADDTAARKPKRPKARPRPVDDGPPPETTPAPSPESVD